MDSACLMGSISDAVRSIKTMPPGLQPVNLLSSPKQFLFFFCPTCLFPVTDRSCSFTCDVLGTSRIHLTIFFFLFLNSTCHSWKSNNSDIFRIFTSVKFLSFPGWSHGDKTKNKNKGVSLSRFRGRSRKSLNQKA